MKHGLFHIIKRSLLYYRLPALYQFVVILLLAAIITGSLLTGSSVRKSLSQNNQERLANTGIIISSGARYFPVSLTKRMMELSGTPCVAITEMSGWARNFSNGETVLNCQVTGVDNDFFIFNNPLSSVNLKQGEAVINSKLSRELKIETGDEIIVRFGKISDIPADSPFSAEESPFESLFLKMKARPISLLVLIRSTQKIFLFTGMTLSNSFMTKLKLTGFCSGMIPHFPLNRSGDS